MTIMITAIYENGILRPLRPLALPERTQVRVQVEPLPAGTAAAEHRQCVREALTVAGLSLPITVEPQNQPHLTYKRRAELARCFAVGGPLSDLIIAEREER